MRSETAGGIAYDDEGTGPTTLLCLPGWCGPRTVFQPLVDRLAKTHRVLSLDWRGHGDSASDRGDFGQAELIDDAVAVIDHADADTVTPVALSHAGWVAVGLRRRLGAARIPRLALIDWMVLGPPPSFLGALDAMRDPATTRQVIDGIIEMWRSGLDLAELDAYLKEMAATPDEMWQRAAREISAAFEAEPVPLQALGEMDQPPPTLHLYAQPSDHDFLEGQRQFAAAHPWFSVERLSAGSHFPMFEVPDAMAEALVRFAG